MHAPSASQAYRIVRSAIVHLLFILFIYYKIVHTVQDRQNGQSNIKSGIKAK